MFLKASLESVTNCIALETHEHQGIPRIFSMTKSTHDAARQDASASWIRSCHWIIYQNLMNQKRKLCQAEGKTCVPLFCLRMTKKLGSWPIFDAQPHFWQISIENNRLDKIQWHPFCCRFLILYKFRKACDAAQECACFEIRNKVKWL